MSKNQNHRQSWMTGAVIYQVYTRSFLDSNHDGIGDINGIRQRLDYLNDGHGGGLGVDCLWVNTIFPSPMKDFGYDITDYYSIEPTLGTMHDFAALIKEAHARGIRILIDLVVNHTSDQHEWFQESCHEPDGPKGDWFIWRNAKPDGSPPNNWISVFGGSAWQWNTHRQQYYLHSFTPEQPDLNWENVSVRHAVADIARFWLNKGVDGFRVDAVNYLGKDYAFPDEPPEILYDPQTPYSSLNHLYSRDSGHMYKYLRFLDSVIQEYDNKLLILETMVLKRQHPELYWRFYHELNSSTCLPFNFELIFMQWSSNKIQSFLDEFQAGLRSSDYPVYAIGNHDNPRFTSKTNPLAARSAALLLLTLPGISFIYNGDELGMSDAQIKQDKLDFNGRDGCRSPMQWTNEKYGGFSDTKPWMILNKNYKKVNAARQLTDPNSSLNLYARLISLRHSNKALQNGTYRPGPKSDQTIAFFREKDEESFLVIINCSDKHIQEVFPPDYHLVTSTTTNRQQFDGSLEPFEGVVLQKQPAVVRQPIRAHRPSIKALS